MFEGRRENIGNMSENIQSFTELKAWQESRKLASLVYRVTEGFPKTEVFGLTNQMRRAVISVSSNIAEGFGRSSLKERIQFYLIARGSVLELQSQLFIASDLKFLSKENQMLLVEQAEMAGKLLNGLIRKTKSFSNV